MKRLLCMFMSIILFCNISVQSLASELHDISKSSKNLLEFISSDKDNMLLNSRNFVYMKFIENFRSDPVSLGFLEATNIFIQTGTEPNTEKYIEILQNIIVTFDLDNASNLAVQNNMDNLKSAQDYLIDLTSMAGDIISILTSNPSVGKLENNITIAVDGVNTLIGNTDNWIKAFSNLQTILQDYSKYDEFLSLIESNGEGNLKEAASMLRKGMAKSLELYLNTYVNISNGDNLDNYSEFIFSNFAFETIKTSSEYVQDDNVKFFVDGGQKVFEKYSVLKSSWDLGKKIGVLIGDAVVGGSNMILRLQETMALYDISKVLQDELRKKSDEFLKSELSKDVTPLIRDYVMHSTFLASCRIRGEYCLYSIVANDAGLMSWFNKASGENAKLWYDMQAKSIDDIQGQINSIIVNDNENTLNTNNESMFGEWEIDTNYTNDHNAKTTFDMFGTGYSYGSSLSLNEDKSFSYGVGIGYYGTGTYEIDNNTIKVHIDDYMEFEPDIGYDFTINIIEENGSVLLELKGFDENFNLYWKKNTLPKDVRDIRDYCNWINNEIFIYEKEEEENLYTRYFDNGKCIKIELQPSDLEFRDNYMEFYYENEKPVFISISNGMKFYYKDGMLIRWIDEVENVYDYNPGIDPYSLDMTENYYLLAQMEIAYMYGG